MPTKEEEFEKLQTDPAFGGGQFYARTPGGIVDVNTGQIIDSSVLQTTPINYETPQYLDIFQPIETERQAEKEIGGIRELTSKLTEEPAFAGEQEKLAGVPELKKTQQDLISQLTALKNEALAIPLQLQQEFRGRGVTAAGAAPIQTERLRENAIKALGVASLLESSRGNLAQALDLVEKAVKQKFDPIKEEIRVKQANLELLLKSPSLSLAEKKRAFKQQEIQEQRKNQVEKQAENAKTAQAMAAAAIKNQPDDPLASFNAQQVLKLNPASSDYLQKVFELVGDYQTNPIEIQKAILENRKAELEEQKLQADIDNKPLQKEKLRLELKKIQAEIVKLERDSFLETQQGLSSFVQTSPTGQEFIDLSNIEDSSLKKQLQAQAIQQGIPAVSLTTQQKDTLSNFATITEIINQVEDLSLRVNTQENYLDRQKQGLNYWKQYVAGSNPDVILLKDQGSKLIQLIKGLGDVGAIPETQVRSAEKNIPQPFSSTLKVSDSKRTAEAKIKSLRDIFETALKSKEKAYGISKGDSKIQKGIIKVRRKSDGKIGRIPAEEFDSNLYAKL